MYTPLFSRYFQCVALAVLTGWLLAAAAAAADIRKPVVAGLWYPASQRQLQAQIAALTRRAQRTPIHAPGGARLRALILPHAGLVYSGWTAAHAGRVLSPGKFQRVVLMGPDHRVGFEHGAIADVDAYQTPLGLAPLDAAAHRLRQSSPLFRSVPASDRSEHCLEAVLPFLQYYLTNVTLVPIVLGRTAPAAMAAAVDAVVDRRTLLVVSSDLSHFMPYERAVAHDRRTIRSILDLDIQSLQSRSNCACGVTPILALLELALKHRWRPVLLHYANSGDTAGDKHRVVGYAAIAFFEGANMSEKSAPQENPAPQFSREQGRKLIRLARRTIFEKLGVVDPRPQTATAAEDFSEPCFQTHCGTFVTLTKNGQLRGCIGNLIASKSVLDGIRENAVQAAFRDPRFPPLSPQEVPAVHISVSILTEPQALQYDDAEDLLRKLRAGEDGVIIRKGSASATFLPQVWEQLPRVEDFLSHLCAKAGLAAPCWRNADLEVLTYQVQYFEEEH